MTKADKVFITMPYCLLYGVPTSFIPKATDLLIP